MHHLCGAVFTTWTRWTLLRFCYCDGTVSGVPCITITVIVIVILSLLATGCTKEFNRPDKLKAHIIAHAGAKPYRCQTCGRTFTRRAHLREHEQFHAENYRFWCEHCHQGFMRQNLLKQHNCTGSSSSTTGQHAFRRKVGRPRKNADSSPAVNSNVEACISPHKTDCF